MEHLDDLLDGSDVVLSDDVLDRIDQIVPPGTDVGTLDMAYRTPALQQARLRRRPVDKRARSEYGLTINVKLLTLVMHEAVVAGRAAE